MKNTRTNDKKNYSYETKHVSNALSRKRSLMIFVAMLSISLITAHIVQAEDTKVYPGSMAVPYMGPNPAYNQSCILNPSSSSWLYVDLPIISDQQSGVKDSYVNAVDRNYNEAVWCSLITVLPTGNGGKTYQKTVPSTVPSGTDGSSDQTKTLRFPPLKGDGISHYFFSCKIPPVYNGFASSIVNYRVKEY